MSHKQQKKSSDDDDTDAASMHIAFETLIDASSMWTLICAASRANYYPSTDVTPTCKTDVVTMIVEHIDRSCGGDAALQVAAMKHLAALVKEVNIAHMKSVQMVNDARRCAGAANALYAYELLTLCVGLTISSCENNYERGIIHAVRNMDTPGDICVCFGHQRDVVNTRHLTHSVLYMTKSELSVISNSLVFDCRITLGLFIFRVPSEVVRAANMAIALQIYNIRSHAVLGKSLIPRDGLKLILGYFTMKIMEDENE